MEWCWIAQKKYPKASVDALAVCRLPKKVSLTHSLAPSIQEMLAHLKTRNMVRAGFPNSDGTYQMIFSENEIICFFFEHNSATARLLISSLKDDYHYYDDGVI